MSLSLNTTEPISRADRLTLDLGLTPQPAESRREARFVLDVLGLAPGSHVLDAPCGAGRHALAFAEAGFSVTAIDLDPVAVAHATETLSGLAVDVIAFDLFGDIPPFNAPTCDAVVSLYSCLGYTRDIDADRRLLSHLRMALQSSESLVIGTANGHAVFALGENRSCFCLGDVTIDRHDIPHVGLGLLERRFTVCDRSQSAQNPPTGFTEVRRLYDAAGVTNLLLGAGFRIEALYAGFSLARGNPARDPHLIYHARAV